MAGVLAFSGLTFTVEFELDAPGAGVEVPPPFLPAPPRAPAPPGVPPTVDLRARLFLAALKMVNEQKLNLQVLQKTKIKLTIFNRFGRFSLSSLFDKTSKLFIELSHLLLDLEKGKIENENGHFGNELPLISVTLKL